jgi:hypothetical protein
MESCVAPFQGLNAGDVSWWFCKRVLKLWKLYNWDSVVLCLLCRCFTRFQHHREASMSSMTSSAWIMHSSCCFLSFFVAAKLFWCSFLQRDPELLPDACCWNLDTETMILLKRWCVIAMMQGSYQWEYFCLFWTSMRETERQRLWWCLFPVEKCEAELSIPHDKSVIQLVLELWSQAFCFVAAFCNAIVCVFFHAIVQIFCDARQLFGVFHWRWLLIAVSSHGKL